MTIKVVNPFKAQTAKTFDKSKIDPDVHADEYFPSADVKFCSGKKIFKFGATTTVVDVDNNLSKANPSEHMRSVQSSSFLDACADIQAEKQKKIISKVKSAKNRITKLFKPTSRGSATVLCLDPFVIPGVENCNTNDHPSALSLPPILRRAKSEARVVAAAYESIPPTLEAIASSVTYGENVADERVKELASASCSIVEASFLSSTRQLFTTPESPFDALSLPFLPSERHTSKGEDGRTEVVLNTEHRELAASASRISRSIGDSEVTVYFSSNSLSAHTTASEIDLVNSEANASPIATSFATSVDAEDNHQFLPGALRGLRRVPNCEDLRNLQIIENRDLSCFDMSCGSSDCDISEGAAPSIRAAPLRRWMKCDNLRKSFLSFEPKIYTPSTRQTNKFRKFPAWLSTRCHESSHNIQRVSVSQASSEHQKVTPVSRSRQFLQGIFRPSSRVRVDVSKPSSHQSLPPSSPPIWSCAKITRSSSKAKRRRRMTKQSMRKLKTRLDSMDIDPWD